jgi:hypothetical protein
VINEVGEVLAKQFELPVKRAKPHSKFEDAPIYSRNYGLEWAGQQAY